MLSPLVGTLLLLITAINGQGPPKMAANIEDIIDEIFSKSPVIASNTSTPNIDDIIRDVFGTGNNGDMDQNNGGIDQNNGGVDQNNGGMDQNTGNGDNVDSSGSSENNSDDDDFPNPCTVGECIAHYLCKNGTVSTDGAGILDIRFGEDDEKQSRTTISKSKHPCKRLFDICCSLPTDKPIIAPIKKPDGCGYRNPKGVGFQITGNTDNEAQFAEFPWMVAILKENRKHRQSRKHAFKCGGSLFHPSVVLTAAHCVDNKTPQQLRVRAGEWDSQTIDEIFPHQDRQVSEIVVHKRYNAGNLYNDIALLFLVTPIELAENINTACMPPPNYAFEGNRCFATGWGKDSFGKAGKRSAILKRVELPIVTRRSCERALRKTRLGPHFELDESFICAGGGRGQDTCKGDGGSPLVCEIPGSKNRYYQAGIVSWGIGCGDGSPGVYVNVAMFRDWIDKKVRKRGIESISYYNIY